MKAKYTTTVGMKVTRNLRRLINLNLMVSSDVEQSSFIITVGFSAPVCRFDFITPDEASSTGHGESALLDATGNLKRIIDIS